LTNSLLDYLKKKKFQINFKNKKIYYSNENETIVHIVEINVIYAKN